MSYILISLPFINFTKCHGLLPISEHSRNSSCISFHDSSDTSGQLFQCSGHLGSGPDHVLIYLQEYYHLPEGWPWELSAGFRRPVVYCSYWHHRRPLASQEARMSLNLGILNSLVQRKQISMVSEEAFAQSWCRSRWGSSSHTETEGSTYISGLIIRKTKSACASPLLCFCGSSTQIYMNLRDFLCD